MGDGYQTFELVWCDRTIEVSYQDQYLGSMNWHIQLRCDERLPVTETGYRSIFLHQPDPITEMAVRTFVVACLDEAADTPGWHKYLDDSRRLSLF